MGKGEDGVRADFETRGAMRGAGFVRGANHVSRPGRRPTRWLLALGTMLIVGFLTVACGEEETTTEIVTEAVPTATAVTTVSAEVPITGGLPAKASPAASPATSGALTLGELADRIDAAWNDVDTYRVVFVSAPGGGPLPPPAGDGSPVASPVTIGSGAEIRREVVVPDRQRQVVTRDGEIVSEAVATGERLYVRGELAQLVLPELDAGTWIEVDPATAAPSTRLGQTLAGLAAPIFSPTVNLPENLRPQEVRPLGPVEVDGRNCESYGAADTTQTGERIDLTLAIGADGLPCFIETRAGEIVSRVTYDAYNQPLTIEPPATAVAIASPFADATPVGQD